MDVVTSSGVPGPEGSPGSTIGCVPGSEMTPAPASAMVPLDVLAEGFDNCRRKEPGLQTAPDLVRKVPVPQQSKSTPAVNNSKGVRGGAKAKRPREYAALLLLVQQHNPIKPGIRQRPKTSVTTVGGKSRSTRWEPALRRSAVSRVTAGVKPVEGPITTATSLGLERIAKAVLVAAVFVRAKKVTTVLAVDSVAGSPTGDEVNVGTAKVALAEALVDEWNAPVLEEEVAAARGVAVTRSSRGLDVRADDFVPAVVPPPIKAASRRVVKIMRMGATVRSPKETSRGGRRQVKVSRPRGCVGRWQEAESELIVEPLYFRAKLGGKEVRIMYDTGAQTQMVSASTATYLGVATVPTEMSVEYGDGSQVLCDRITTRQTIYIQESSFLERFLVVKDDIPGVDIVLGMGFALRSGANVVWPKDGTNDVPYLSFKDGTRWYGEDVVGTSNALRFCSINAEQVGKYVKDCKGDFTMLSVSLEELMTREEALKRSPQNPVAAVLQAVLDDFPDIFREDLPMDLPTQRQDQPNSIHKIPLLEGAEPVKVRTLPMSQGQRLLLMELLKELLDKGYISPAPDNSQWSAPIFLLKKGDGNKPGPVSANWRLITDFRALNALTKPSVYVPPSVREVLDALVHKKVFSRSDNLSGFYQAALAEEDRIKTTFTCFTPEGHKRSYYFNVSCLGLQGAPSSYQLFMEDVIAGIPDVVCYIDDLAYASNTLEEHAVLMRTVFTRLRQNQVYLNAAKCQWGLAGMDFLGMHVSHNHVRISDDKVQGLRDYPVPKSFEDVRRFVGFANYVGQFVCNFSTQVLTLTDMLKQQKEVKKKFVWPAAAEEEFNSIREKLIASAGLVIPDLRGEFVVETDASGLGMGAVLYQFIRGPGGEEGRLVPVWFMSRKFADAEVNYNTRDREALAVTFALLKCRQYLLLSRFVLYSDHESLANFKVQPGLKGKDWRHQEIVGEFDFVQRYRKGELMVAPDALSRAFDDRVTAYTVWAEVDHMVHRAALPGTTAGVPPVVSFCRVQLKRKYDGRMLPSIAEADESVQQTEVSKNGKRRVVNAPRRWRAAEWVERLKDMRCCPLPMSWLSLQQFISRVAVFQEYMPAWRELLEPVLAVWRNRPRVRDANNKLYLPAWVDSEPAVLAARGIRNSLAQMGDQRVPRAKVLLAVLRVLRPEVEVAPAPEFAGLDEVVVQETYDATLADVDDVVESTTITGDWRGDVREAYKQDEVFGPIVTLCQKAVDTLTLQEKSRVKHYKWLDGSLYFAPRGAGASRLCVPTSPGNALRLVMLYDSHESGVHGGVEKTYARLAARFYWPNMLVDVRRYILSCRSCRTNKARTRAEVGALGGLPIALERWHTVGMDWITDLPLTRLGHNAVLVVEDSVTKYAYFIAAKKTDTAQDAARRAFASVFCLHGAPHTIVSDRDKLFTSKFFGALMALMHVKQAMGTSHYHDFNGAVECLNKTVEVMLRHLLAEFPERDFDELLPMVQWAYNTTVHSATQLSPYFALYGVHPREPMNFVAEPGLAVPPAVAAFAEHQKGVLAITQDALHKAQAVMLEYENRRRKEPDLRVNDYVFLSTINLGKTHFFTTVAKLQERFVGPYKIVEKRSDYKFRLELPKSLRGVYPVFHASLLWRALPTPPDMAGRLGAGVALPVEGEPEEEEGADLLTHDDAGEAVYVIEEVLQRRRSGRGYEYLVKWVGYEDPVDNWWLTRKDAVTTAAERAFDNFDRRQDQLEGKGQEKVPAREPVKKVPEPRKTQRSAAAGAAAGTTTAQQEGAAVAPSGGEVAVPDGSSKAKAKGHRGNQHRRSRARRN